MRTLVFAQVVRLLQTYYHDVGLELNFVFMKSLVQLDFLQNRIDLLTKFSVFKPPLQYQTDLPVVHTVFRIEVHATELWLY